MDTGRPDACFTDHLFPERLQLRPPQNMNPILPTRLKAGLPGLGQASQTDIEIRAAELAHSDGRPKATASDLEQAEAELAGGATSAKAQGGQSDVIDLTAWDDPLDQSGHRVAGSENEDDRSIGEQLIEDGVEEADHDIRTAATEVPPE